MPITNGYATQAELEAWVGDTLVTADAERSVEASSRWVDSFCGRAFWQATGQARVFEACSPTLLELGAFNDLVSVSALATDQDGDGTFETTWAASDYQLLPIRPASAPETQPYTQVLAIAGRNFPTFRHGRAGRVQVTGTWGWPAIPTAVKQACLMQAARIYKRRISPEGVAGFGSEFGPMRLSAKPDPDAIELIKPYRLVHLLVG